MRARAHEAGELPHGGDARVLEREHGAGEHSGADEEAEDGGFGVGLSERGWRRGAAAHEEEQGIERY